MTVKATVRRVAANATSASTRTVRPHHAWPSVGSPSVAVNKASPAATIDDSSATASTAYSPQDVNARDTASSRQPRAAPTVARGTGSAGDSTRSSATGEMLLVRLVCGKPRPRVMAGYVAIVTAADFVPQGVGLDGLRDAARGCRGCHLYENATQTVFSRGPVSARLVLVGEQPGDVEDRRGEPFVGPAGKLLDRAISEAGLDPEQTYTTNAVKHFKFTPAPTGKRRIHATPDTHEIGACRPWLVAEFAVLDPEVVVAH